MVPHMMGTPGVRWIHRQKAISGQRPSGTECLPRARCCDRAVRYGSDRGRSTPACASKKSPHRRGRGQGDGPTVTQKWPGTCPHPVQPKASGKPHNPSWGGDPGAKASTHSPHLPPFLTERLHKQGGQWAGEQEGSQWGQRARGCKHNREPSKFPGTKPQSQRNAPEVQGARH